MYKNAHDRPSVSIQLGFNDDTVSLTIRIRFQLLHFSYEQYVFKQFIQSFFFLCRNRNHNDIPTPFFTKKSFMGKLFLNTFRICAGFINLINGYHNRHPCILRMMDCFHSLRHNAVVSRYDQDSDIRQLCAAGAHCCKCLMSRSIKKCNLMIFITDLVGTDTLCDTAGFMHSHIRRAQRVKQSCFAMINVSHNSNYCRTRF